jgi:hypothetical protein
MPWPLGSCVAIRLEKDSPPTPSFLNYVYGNFNFMKHFVNSFIAEKWSRPPHSCGRHEMQGIDRK